jgi:hypothetical protein
LFLCPTVVEKGHDDSAPHPAEHHFVLQVYPALAWVGNGQSILFGLGSPRAQSPFHGISQLP